MGEIVQKEIKSLIEEHIKVSEKLLDEKTLLLIEDIADIMVDTYKNGNKVIVFGNGGSAADAQHFVAELVCRFEKNRSALPAIALTTNTSTLTAIGNDFSFDDVFSRQIAAFAKENDLVIGISTSGNSPNVLKAIDEANLLKARTIGFSGEKGAKLKDKVDKCFCAPSTATGRIQECHILVIHILCRLVENALFAEK
ncbi:SIS domain-containing protein [Elusimicrobiota bacterium]